MTTNFGKGRMDMECKLSKTIWQSKIDYKRRHINFYDKKKALYLETDIFGVGLGTGLLQTRKGMSCPRDDTPDNNIPRPITSARKSLSAVENDTVT